jgi:hypothetical protein
MATTPLYHVFGFNPLAVPESHKNHKWPEFMGIELELEGIRADEAPSIGGWVIHDDGSLRGGVEYVTAGPFSGPDLEKAIDHFYDRKLIYTKGPRTSTHIHLNMTESTDTILRSMFVLMYMIEDGIYNAVEENRKWAGYSVALSEMGTDRIRGILNPGFNATQFVNSVSPNRNAERYYGFNTILRRHGTVEFRYFPGGPTKEELHKWLDLVVLVKKIATKYTVDDYIAKLETPDAIMKFMTEEFGEWGYTLTNAFSPDRMLDRLHEVLPLYSDVDTRMNFQKVYALNPLYVALVKKHALRDSEKAIAMIEPYIAVSKVHAANEWQMYLEEAIQHVPNSARPRQTSGRSGRPGPLPRSRIRRVDEDDDDEYHPEYEEEESGWEDIPPPTMDPFQASVTSNPVSYNDPAGFVFDDTVFTPTPDGPTINGPNYPWSATTTRTTARRATLSSGDMPPGAVAPRPAGDADPASSSSAAAQAFDAIRRAQAQAEMRASTTRLGMTPEEIQRELDRLHAEQRRAPDPNYGHTINQLLDEYITASSRAATRNRSNR